MALSRVLDTIARLGYRPHPITPEAAASVALKERRTAMRRLVVAGLGMMQVMTYAVSLYAGAWQGMSDEIREFLRLVSLLVATPVLFYSGAPFFIGAWRDLAARRPGMDVPVALALALAYGASLYNSLRGEGEVYFDSVTMFVFFLSLGRFVEMSARHRAGEVADALAKLAPATALRLQPGAATPLPVAIAELEPGDRLLVRPGDTFPADGVVSRGRAEVDESLLTGESRSLVRTVGEDLVGGSINIGDPVEMTVSRTGNDTVLSHMTRLLERAQASRPALAHSADRLARWFVTGVLLTAAVVGLAWWFKDPALAFPTTLAVLVVTCPCALSLATPTALTAATSRLAALGLLVTRGDALEKLARADRLVLDKTGTLTEGRVRIVDVLPLRDLAPDRCRAIAAALEVGSEHPLARAFDDPAGMVAQALRVLPGRGLEGTIDGRLYRLGSPSFAGGPHRDRLPAAASVVLADDEGPVAGFVLTDPLRADAPATMAELARRGLAVEIASGDVAPIVESVAREAGIESWRASLSPEDKLEHIRDLQAQGAVVAMVGDGINDAPVLAGADVSIAMGEGAPLAQSSADMILLGRTLDTAVTGRRRGAPDAEDHPPEPGLGPQLQPDRAAAGGRRPRRTLDGGDRHVRELAGRGPQLHPSRPHRRSPAGPSRRPQGHTRRGGIGRGAANVTIIYVLIPVGLVFLGLGIWAFFWASGSGQYDDLESPAWRILMDDDSRPPSAGQTGAEEEPDDGDAPKR